MYKRKKQINFEDEKGIQQILDSVLDEVPSTSKNENKMAKKRRNAIDCDLPPLLDKMQDAEPKDADPKDAEPKDAPKCSCELTEVKEMLRQISADIKHLKRSHSYEIKKLEEKIGFYFSSKDGSRSLSELKSFLNLDEPLKTLNAFEEFEKKLKTETDFLDSLREVIAYKVRAVCLTEAVNNFLSILLDPQLQVQFSACGKLNKGVNKENFSSTVTYNTFKDCLLMQFKAETEANILTKTSRWFANSKDRFIGRKSRN